MRNLSPTPYSSHMVFREQYMCTKCVLICACFHFPLGSREGILRVQVSKPIWAVCFQHPQPPLFPSSHKINLHLSVTLSVWMRTTTSSDHYTANSLSSSQGMLVNKCKRQECCHRFLIVVFYQHWGSTETFRCNTAVNVLNPYTPFRLVSVKDYKNWSL